MTAMVGRTRAERQLVEQLPDAVDLLALVVASGGTPRHAVEAVATYEQGAIGAAFRGMLQDLDDRGGRLADALATLPEELGEAVGSVIRPLVAAERYGTPMGPTLELVGRDLRAIRRQRAEERIRRVPVKLLFPLVLCTLPAFALLTIVPLLAVSLGRLH